MKNTQDVTLNPKMKFKGKNSQIPSDFKINLLNQNKHTEIEEFIIVPNHILDRSVHLTKQIQNLRDLNQQTSPAPDLIRSNFRRELKSEELKI